MHKEVGWYLVELERTLAGKVPDEQLQSLIAEVESHLTESSTALSESGEQEPGLKAAKEFGPVRRFASQVLESAASPSRRLVWGIVAALAGVWLCVIPIWIMLQSERPGFEPIPPTLLMAGVGILTAGLAIWRSRTRLFGSLLAGSAIGAISLTGFAVFGMLDLGEPDGMTVLPRTHADASKWIGEKQKLESIQSRLNDARVMYSYEHTEPLPFKEFKTPNGWRVPVEVMIDKSEIWLNEVTVPDHETARLTWRHGRKAFLEAESEIEWREMLLNSLPAAKSRTIGEQLRSFSPQTLGWSGACLAALWILGFVVDTLRRSLQLRPKRWALR